MEEESDGNTLDEALSSVGFGTFQGLALVFAGIGWFAEAMEMSLLSFIGPALKSEWLLSPTAESLLSTTVFGGMLLGACFWGFISDAYGRRIAIQAVSTIMFGAGLSSAFSPDYRALLIIRFLMGFGAAGGHVFLSWFLEFLPSSNRGAWMILMTCSWIIGDLFEASLAWAVMPRLGWRWLLALSSIPSFMLLLFSIIAPETPRYPFMKGRTDEAISILEKMALLNRKELPIGNLVSDHHHKMLPDDGENCPTETTLLLSSNVNETSRVKKFFKSLSELFSSDLLGTTLLLWSLSFVYTFSYYGLLLMISSLSSGESDCNILRKSGFSDNLYVSVFMSSLAELPGLLLAIVLVDRFGRKVCMEALSILTVMVMLPLLSHQNGVVTAALLICGRMFLCAAFNTLCVYSAEVYPTSVRATGYGISAAVGRVGGMVCPLVAVGLVRGCHQTLAVILFGIVILISGIGVMLFPFETKGKQLTDIVS